MQRKLVHDLSGPLVPTGHVVNYEHAGKWACAERLRDVGVDLIIVVTAAPDGS